MSCVLVKRSALTSNVSSMLGNGCADFYQLRNRYQSRKREIKRNRLLSVYVSRGTQCLDLYYFFLLVIGKAFKEKSTPHFFFHPLTSLTRQGRWTKMAVGVVFGFEEDLRHIPVNFWIFWSLRT